MRAKEYHRNQLNLNEKDFERLVELGQIKEIDYELMESYHQHRVDSISDEEIQNMADRFATSHMRDPKWCYVHGARDLQDKLTNK